MLKGKAKTNLVAVDDHGYGDKIEKIINVYVDGIVIYANLEQKTIYMSTDSGATWDFIGQEGEHHFQVYIGKTIDEVIALYKEYATDIVTWIEPLAEV